MSKRKLCGWAILSALIAGVAWLLAYLVGFKNVPLFLAVAMGVIMTACLVAAILVFAIWLIQGGDK